MSASASSGASAPAGALPATNLPATNLRNTALPEATLPAGTLIIADLHLDPREQRGWRAFGAWLEALEAPALLILGDFFEFWSGAAQVRREAYRALLAALARRSRAGLELHFLHGNRDFLLGPAFERAVGGRVHPNGLIGLLPGMHRVLFLHGDELATLDLSYQRFRRLVRSRPVRTLADALPGALSGAIARCLRFGSRRAVAAKSVTSVELQSSAAEAWCRQYSVRGLVCGHKHCFHDEALPGGARWVVLDAFGGARDVLRVNATGELTPESSGMETCSTDVALYPHAPS